MVDITVTTRAETYLPLRQRKKLNAMRRIQTAAIELVEANGYSAVTIEEIAAQAEVSPSSIYRYFDTKEGVFLWDEGVDDSALEEFATLAADQTPIAAMRQAVHSLVENPYIKDEARILRQFRLMMSTPELADAMRARVDEMRRQLVDILAASTLNVGGRGTGTGQPGDDLTLNVISAAVMGAFTATVETWVKRGGSPPLSDLLDEALDILERGLER